MGTRSFIIIEDNGEFRGVYCHWDGYLESNGASLLTYYTTAEQVNALIDGGDMSTLGCSPESCEYHKDRGDKWKDVKPTVRRNLASVMRMIEGSGCKYVYLFEAETMQWSYAERGAQFFGLGDGSEFSAFTPLATALTSVISE